MQRVGRTAIVAAALLLLPAGATRAQPQQPASCPPTVAPVCAVKGDTKQSYWNECLALRDGALVIRTGECPNPRSYGVGDAGQRNRRAAARYELSRASSW